MNDNTIMISNINDFLFCPLSIYFHNLVGNFDRMMLQSTYQINGSHAHRTIDTGTYSSRSACLQGVEIYCEEYGIAGKIDVFDIESGTLTEKKKKISRIFDGQILQVYAQYFALKEMGYDIKKIRIYSMDDNKNYDIELPENDIEMKNKFDDTVREMRSFNPLGFRQTNELKCARCIYEPMCGNSSLDS
jgi:RecB family exonuclease